MKQIEQLNIEGKRSGEGFVTHKAKLINALERALSERVTLLNDVTLGRKGLLTYLKALGGSNIVKIAPSNGSASGLRITGKSLKVVCGANTSYLEDMAWIGDNTPVTICNVRVSPSNSVKPNLGALELSEALSRVLPFTSAEEARPVFQNVYFLSKEGKLHLVSADGFRLSVVTLDYDDGEGTVLINREELKGIAGALRRAKRVRLAFEGEDIKTLILDTELVRYKWTSDDGSFPEYEKLIPAEHKCLTHFDTTEALRAVSSLKALSGNTAYPIDLTISEGKIVLANPDDKGQTEITAETEGEVRIRLDGSFLMDALKACGGMAELRLTDGKSPVLFTSPDYKLVVMPMLTGENREAETPEPKSDTEGEAEANTEPQSEPETAETEPEAEAKPKPKRKGKVKEPVAVA